MRYTIILFILTLMSATIRAQPFENKTYSDNVWSVQVYPEGNPLGYPLIALGSGEKLEFHFDVMGNEFETYRYGIIHCDHDWQVSGLNTNEYIQGFQTDQISQFENSFSTMFDYVHYQFSYPTDMSTPRYSGNYVMIVFSGTDIENRASWIITYRMMIYENAVSILSNVHQSSIIADRYTSQEVDFDISHKDFRIYDPMREINVSILQNFNWNNAIQHLKPIFLKTDVMTFDYSSGENAFDGGNEYRNFEMKDIRYTSAETESITLLDDGYHILLRTDLPEGRKAYATWNDLNGNWLVRSDQADDSDIESDYVWIHFRYQSVEMEESEVIIEGNFTQFKNKELKCTYDQSLKMYTCIALVKQGYYNYRYVIRDRFFSKENLRTTEGSHSNTENDYHIIVYMFDRNLGCDRIIAVKADNSVR